MAKVRTQLKTYTPELRAKHHTQLSLMFSGHATDLRNTIDHLRAGNTKAAVKILGFAVSRLERVLFRQAQELGYKPRKAKRGNPKKKG